MQVSKSDFTIGQNVKITYLKQGSDQHAEYTGQVIENGIGPAGAYVKIDTAKGPRSLTLSRIYAAEVC